MRFLFKRRLLQQQQTIRNPATGEVRCSIANQRRERKDLRNNILIRKSQLSSTSSSEQTLACLLNQLDKRFSQRSSIILALSHNALSEWLRDWTGRVQVTSGSPTELRKNVQEAQLLLLRWTEAQQHLWQGWFQLVQQIGPLLEADSQADEHLLSSLQESGQAIVNAQEEWVRRMRRKTP
jgi:hypothetical protein